MRRRVLGACALVVALLLAVAVPASAHKGGHHGKHHRFHGDVVVVKPGESIQAAVDAAAPGTTIVVKRGTYAENVAITTDGITLKSRGAELVPPQTPAPNACSGTDPAGDGICAIGDVEFPADGPPVVKEPISDVEIKGFEITGFPANGILFLGAEDVDAEHNVLKDNGEYGIARFVSSGGKIVHNWASGSSEAGIYVGDSPDADVLIAGNATPDNILFGIFLRDAGHGKVWGNWSSGNCVGAIVLNTGSNVAGDWLFARNKLKDNTRFCPANEEEGAPPLSGIGLAIAGGHDNLVVGNKIKGNVPSGESAFSGGVVVADLGIPGANPPSGNVVKRNLIVGNEPDIFWDGSGTENVFERNLCRTSVPDGLCNGFKGFGKHRFGDHHGKFDDHGRDRDDDKRGDDDDHGDDDHGDDDRHGDDRHDGDDDHDDGGRR